MTPEAQLGANLQALEGHDPALAERLRLPVEAGHVLRDDTGRLQLRLHQSKTPLELDAAACAAAAQGVGAGPVLLFGCGAGELGEHLLARGAQVTVWDRDPWMLRLLLQRRDFAAELGDGRLRLALGVDLLEELRAGRKVVLHPVLAQVYRNERHLLAGVGPRRALICAGGLFVDDLADALRARDYAVYTLEADRLAVEELNLTVARLAPQLIGVVNYTEGLGEFAAQHGVPLLCWEVDPTLYRLNHAESDVTTTHVFTYRAAHVPEYQAAGFTHAEFLPLASNPVRRARPKLPPDEAARYAAPVAFVGASLVDRVPKLREDFIAAFARYRGGRAGAREEGAALLDDLLARQRQDFTRYQLPQWLGAAHPQFVALGKRPGALDVEQVAGELAAGEKRLTYVSALGPLGVHVWGDHGWDLPALRGCYRGSAGHFVELNKIYCGAAINVDIGRLYQMDIVTMRVYDVLSCGGFLLTERAPALDELFTPGVHLDVFGSADELCDKVRFYGAHPEAAARMAEAGQALVYERHTVGHRVAHMLQRLGLAPR